MQKQKIVGFELGQKSIAVYRDGSKFLVKGLGFNVVLPTYDAAREYAFDLFTRLVVNA